MKNKQMKKLKQSQLAKEIGISTSYLSMILKGHRNCPLELAGKLQSIPGIHKLVNNPLEHLLPKQRVASSSLVSRSSPALNIKSD